MYVTFLNGTGLCTKKRELYVLNHGNFGQCNSILTLRKGFQIVFHDNATLSAASYITKFLENHPSNNITNNIKFTLRFQSYVLYYIFTTLFDIRLYYIMELGRSITYVKSFLWTKQK